MKACKDKIKLQLLKSRKERYFCIDAIFKYM